MPMKPMSVEQCVSEGLNALRENRSKGRSGPDEPHHEHSKQPSGAPYPELKVARQDSSAIPSHACELGTRGRSNCHPATVVYRRIGSKSLHKQWTPSKSGTRTL
jgi:hypothetical protein